MATFDGFGAFLAEFRAKRQEMNDNRRQECLTIAFDTIALIQDRIQKTSQNYQGEKFADYSVDYAVYGREELGYQSARFDMTRTGDFWKAMQSFVEREDFDEIVIVIKAKDQENQDKLNGQFEKRGNILLLQEFELNELRLANADRVIKYFT